MILSADLKGKKRASKGWLLVPLAILALAWWFCLPSQLFGTDMATLVSDVDGEIIGASVAADGQMRLPAPDTLPSKVETAILEYEDRHFYQHPGVNPVALVRATMANLSSGRLKQGGSTITMQVVRLATGRRERTLWRKGVEMAMATRLEATYSKQEILKLYAGHAPYGGNIVGVEAASWRIFRRPLASLTWAEAAVLAVLPNAPSLINSGRNRPILKAKRDRLLRILGARGLLSGSLLALSVESSLPMPPLPLPSVAPHFFAMAKRQYGGQSIQTTLQSGLQGKCVATAADYLRNMESMQVGNAAFLVLERKNANLLAYGSANLASGQQNGSNWVDVAQAERSYGSLLKPFLYKNALEKGLILPNSWLEDIPITIKGFAPKNFSNTFQGYVPAREALATSQNLPFVALLNQYGTAGFLSDLQGLGISTLDRPASHYGLSLILGGGEAKLWELAQAYLSLPYKVGEGPLPKINYIKRVKGVKEGKPPALSAAGYCTLQALSIAQRPDLELPWEHYLAENQIAWKTGTSQGLRDAWAIGMTGTHLVAVWLGNADGEGRAGLTGIGIAAPLLFKLFAHLPKGTGFVRPRDGWQATKVCHTTQLPASVYCDSAFEMMTPRATRLPAACGLHTPIFCTADGAHRVNGSCYPLAKAKQQNSLVMPPVQAYYYKKTRALKALPPWLAGCAPAESQDGLRFIYPGKNGTVISLPDSVAGKKGEVILSAYCAEPKASVHWHIDGEYVLSTVGEHVLPVRMMPGQHRISIISSQGSMANVAVQVR